MTKEIAGLLAQAGFPNGGDISSTIPRDGYPKDREVLQIVALRWSRAVFASAIRTRGIFWTKKGAFNGGRLPFYYIGRGSLTDADTLYDQYFRTGTTKRTNYSNPALDKLVEDQQKTADQKKRVAILQQAGKVIMDEALFIPLYNLADIYGAARNLVWKKTADEKVLGWEMNIK